MDVSWNIFLVGDLGKLRNGIFLRITVFYFREGMLMYEQSLVYVLSSEIHASRKNRIQLNWLLRASLTS